MLSSWHAWSIKFRLAVCRLATERKPAAALEVLACSSELLLPDQHSANRDQAPDVCADPQLWTLLRGGLVSSVPDITAAQGNCALCVLAFPAAACRVLLQGCLSLL